MKTFQFELDPVAHGLNPEEECDAAVIKAFGSWVTLATCCNKNSLEVQEFEKEINFKKKYVVTIQELES